MMSTLESIVYNCLLPLVLVLVLAVIAGWQVHTDGSRWSNCRPNASTTQHHEDPTIQNDLSEKEERMPKQPMDAFLVVDVEGTCDQDIPWGYPNEIIVGFSLIEYNGPVSNDIIGMARMPYAMDG
jgi:hypothetical protein